MHIIKIHLLLRELGSELHGDVDSYSNGYGNGNGKRCNLKVDLGVGMQVSKRGRLGNGKQQLLEACVHHRLVAHGHDKFKNRYDVDNL